MPLYHGTSAARALSIIETGEAQPSASNGVFYCFDSKRPESMVGALCFATGIKLRSGSIPLRNHFNHYCKVNPDFPRGLKGILMRGGLKLAARQWEKQQKTWASSTPELENYPAILLFPDTPGADYIVRAGAVHEVAISGDALKAFKPETVYLDDALMHDKFTSTLHRAGVATKPISAWVHSIYPE